MSPTAPPVDRETGRCIVTTAWETVEDLTTSALEASRGQAEQIRAGTAQEARAEVLDVAEFDLVLAHLHIPEMA